MPSTYEKTAMHPAPSIKLERTSVREGDMVVDIKCVGDSDVEETKLNINKGRNQETESQGFSTEVSSTTTCTNFTEDSKVSSICADTDICKSFRDESVELFIPSPSPSVVEVAVAPKQPPEVIDLDKPSDGNKGVEHELDTSAKYDKAFPHPQHHIAHRYVELLCCGILEQYYKANGTIAMPPSQLDGSIPQKIMMINLYKHLHKNQSKLDAHVARMTRMQIKDANNPEADWSCWNVQSELNFHLEAYLDRIVISSKILVEEEALESCTISWTNVLPLISGGKTLLQLALRQSFSAATPRPTEIWQDKWSPLNLTIPFELFTHCVLRRLPSAELWHETHRQRLLSKWYIEYMGGVAESNQEFILAVVSTFGICIWQYPERILELFQVRDMLKNTCRLPGFKCASSQASDDDSIMSRRNEVLATALREKAEDRSSALAAARLSARQSFAFKYRLTLKEFSNVATQSLKSFHGSTYTVSTEKISTWYRNLEKSDRFIQLLDQALLCLLADNKKFASYSGVKKITAAEYNQCKRSLESELNNRMQKSGVFFLHQITLQMKMELELSYLQLSMAPNVPLLQGWSPINSLFPYDAFCQIVHLIFSKKGEKFQLCNDALRVRYVELMSSYFATNSNQILLAVFGAMGPDLSSCPLRILHILQQKRFIRRDLGLPLCEASNTTPIFKPLDQGYGLKRKLTSTTARTDTSSTSQGQSVVPAPKRVAVSAPAAVLKQANSIPSVFSPRPSQFDSLIRSVSKTAARSNEPPISPLVQKVRIDDNLPSRTHNGVTAETEKVRGWRAAIEEALNTFNLPPLSSNGALDTLERYMEHCGTQVSYKNLQFMQGMHAGISIATKSWQEQKELATENRSKADRTHELFSGNSISGAGHQSAAPQPSQSLCGPYPLAQPTQHLMPQSSAYQYPPKQSTQNHLQQGASYEYAIVQMPMQAGVQYLPYNLQTGSTLLTPPPPSAYASPYTNPQTMAQQSSNFWGAQPPQPTTNPFQPPLPSGPAP